MVASHKELAKKLEELEKKYDAQFKVVFDSIHALLEIFELLNFIHAIIDCEVIMIPKNELDKAIAIAKKHKIGKLYLIGSTLHHDQERARDYDFAVSDIPPGSFFKFYGELFTVMSKTVDLIDLSGKKTKFKDLVLKEGKLIYDKASA